MSCPAAVGLVHSHTVGPDGAPLPAVTVRFPPGSLLGSGADGDPEFVTPPLRVLAPTAPPPGRDGPAAFGLPPVGSQVVVLFTTPPGALSMSGVVLGCVYTDTAPLPTGGDDVAAGARALAFPDGTRIAYAPGADGGRPAVTVSTPGAVHVHAPEVTLGGPDGQPVPLGDDLLRYLSDLHTFVATHVHASAAPGYPTAPPGPTPAPPVPPTAGLLSGVVKTT